MARAPALQAGGNRFDSDILHYNNQRLKGRRKKQTVTYESTWNKPQLIRISEGTLNRIIFRTVIGQQTKFFDILVSDKIKISKHLNFESY